MLVIFAAMIVMAPVIASQLYAFTEVIFQRIETGF
jgi:type III secretory pathway component EscS